MFLVQKPLWNPSWDIIDIYIYLMFQLQKSWTGALLERDHMHTAVRASVGLWAPAEDSEISDNTTEKLSSLVES